MKNIIIFSLLAVMFAPGVSFASDAVDDAAIFGERKAQEWRDDRKVDMYGEDPVYDEDVIYGEDPIGEPVEESVDGVVEEPLDQMIEEPVERIGESIREGRMW